MQIICIYILVIVQLLQNTHIIQLEQLEKANLRHLQLVPNEAQLYFQIFR